MKHVAPLRYDVIFKKAFSQPEIFKAFAKDFLEIDLEIRKAINITEITVIIPIKIVIFLRL